MVTVTSHSALGTTGLMLSVWNFGLILMQLKQRKTAQKHVLNYRMDVDL